ncbi:MAG TPA: IS1595 family transposase [Chitinivibrionales bacterium]|nr:IS1595 family transposase [Chitinivibrionales bacterium]
MLKQFKTLADLYHAFRDNNVALAHFRTIRWRNGEFCPHCGHHEIYYPKKGARFACAQCGERFSILTGTIFENTKLPLKVWFGAIWLISNHPKGIASTTLARDLGITQKSAWFILHRLRHAARTQSFNTPPLKGTVEIDETFVGGKAINMPGRRSGKGGGPSGKTTVIGAVERGGDVVAIVSPDYLDSDKAQAFVDAVVSPKAEMVVTDAGTPYIGLEGYQHEIVNHNLGEIKRGAAHTNSIESVWAQLKRQINGTHHWVSAKHLQQYVSEMTWLMNHRDLTPQERVNALFTAVEGRLTYDTLIGAANE